MDDLDGMSMGPFGIMDAVGLDVVYGIEMVYYNDPRTEGTTPGRLEKDDPAESAGGQDRQGFFNTYPNPEFKKPGF